MDSILLLLTQLVLNSFHLRQMEFLIVLRYMVRVLADQLIMTIKH